MTSISAASRPDSALATEVKPPVSRPAGAFGRVLALSLFIAGLAAVLYLVAVRSIEASEIATAAPWLALVAGYAASELTVVHIEFRRDAHSVSLNEIPLVLALVFATLRASSCSRTWSARAPCSCCTAGRRC